MISRATILDSFTQQEFSVHLFLNVVFSILSTPPRPHLNLPAFKALTCLTATRFPERQHLRRLWDEPKRHN